MPTEPDNTIASSGHSTNLVGVPTGLLASVAFNEFPIPLHISGTREQQVCLRWILQKGHVAIPKSVHRDRIIENADLFGFELSAEEMGTIDSLDTGERVGPHPDRYEGQ